MHSDRGKVVQSVHLPSASLQVSQFQLQGFQAAGTQGAAQQLQEEGAGHHTCQLEQQPPAPCRGTRGMRRWKTAEVSVPQLFYGMRLSAARCDPLEIDKTREKQSVYNGG